jgi:hypothetical protein
MKVLCCELLDGNAAVAQDPLLAVDEGDGALAGARVAVARVEGDEPRLGAKVADVDGALAFRSLYDGQLEVAVADAKMCDFRHGGSFLPDADGAVGWMDGSKRSVEGRV